MCLQFSQDLIFPPHCLIFMVFFSCCDQDRGICSSYAIDSEQINLDSGYHERICFLPPLFGSLLGFQRFGMHIHMHQECKPESAWLIVKCICFSEHLSCQTHPVESIFRMFLDCVMMCCLCQWNDLVPEGQVGWHPSGHDQESEA